MVQTTTILTALQRYFRSEPRIDHAWLFGSFARGDSSDVDVMVEMQSNKRYTLFDLFDIQHKLENMLHRKVDVVEKDFIKLAAWNSAKQDLIAIV